jgi:hypothetical protein
MNGTYPGIAYSRWAILPLLLSADSRYLVISQQLSYSLSELARVFPIAAGHFPAAFLYPVSSGNFHPFSLKGRVSVNIYEKLKEHLKILKLSVAFPRTDLSNKIIFSQSKSHVTVPLSTFIGLHIKMRRSLA